MNALFDSRAFLQQVTERPGVYRMFGARDEILYVGKARNLKRRLASYFTRSTSNPKTAAMVAQTARVEVTVTTTEDQALLLENNLIKAHKPRFNIFFRDDKSFPFIHLSGHAFPQISFRRALRKGPGRWFGPYPNAGAVRETLQSLHRIFRLRECDNSYFSNRSRPCLQYQIKRCSAPCVGYISQADYARDVADASRLLADKSEALIGDLNVRMQDAAARLEFERAALLREQLSAVRRLQSQAGGGQSSADAIAVKLQSGRAGVVVLSIRDGRNLGHQSFFPQSPPGTEADEVLSAFLAQHYVSRPAPAEILVRKRPDEAEFVEAALSRTAQRRVRLRVPSRGAGAEWLAEAEATLAQALISELAAEMSTAQRLEALQQALGLPALPVRMECFDISHTAGERAVASCVVFKQGLPYKTGYRRFNIEAIAPGDDYAAIQQALRRRLAHLQEGVAEVPDIIFIDGGKGQLSAALAAAAETPGAIPFFVAIAKGEERKPGKEQLFLPGREMALILPAESPALHLIQHIRDEAHRFAVTGHRARRGKARRESELETIAGLGPARRRALFQAFGGTRQIAEASIAELKRVAGVSAGMAQRIYEHFHGS
ncbi:MAG: excinuclease ABC subunit UvrC [Nevskiales bacterium]